MQSYPQVKRQAAQVLPTPRTCHSQPLGSAGKSVGVLLDVPFDAED